MRRDRSMDFWSNRDPIRMRLVVTRVNRRWSGTHFDMRSSPLRDTLRVPAVAWYKRVPFLEVAE